MHVPDPKDAKPEPKAQRNFTDPESRIMLDGASKGFDQCYNAQAAVDGAHQIIIAADVTQHVNDKQELVPMMAKLMENMGRLPDNTLVLRSTPADRAGCTPAVRTAFRSARAPRFGRLERRRRRRYAPTAASRRYQPCGPGIISDGSDPGAAKPVRAQRPGAFRASFT